MLVVYDQVTGEIVGHCGKVLDNGEYREATMEEVFGHKDTSNWASLYIEHEARLFRYGMKEFRLVRDADGVVTGIEHNPPVTLRCDAVDTDGDGVPDLPADGTSTTVITARTADKAAGIEIAFRTTRGALSSRTAVTDESGAATVLLRSAAETVPATVTATAEGYRSTTPLKLEFVPAPFN